MRSLACSSAPCIWGADPPNLSSLPPFVPTGRVRKAIFPAAGLATRFLPVTTASKLVEGEACAVLLADDVILGDAEPCLKQLIDAHRQTGATVLAVRRFPRDQVGRYGVVVTSGAKGRLHTVTDMVEKPKPGTEPSDLAILGRYVLAPAVFDELERASPGAGSEIQLTDAIMRTVGKHPVVAIEFEGDYYDTGTVAGYLRANLTLAMRREGLRGQLTPLLRELLGGERRPLRLRVEGYSRWLYLGYAP